MPDARLERTRDSYRCKRSMVIVPWLHCDCRGCQFAREAPRRYRELTRESLGLSLATEGGDTAGSPEPHM